MSVASIAKPAPRAAESADPRWNDALEEHRAALAAFLDVAEALREDAWRAPWAAEKWTRAQVAEHLSLVYAGAVRELHTGEGVRMRVTGLRQRMLRMIMLPHVLFHRSLPMKVKSPRSAWPDEVAEPRAVVLKRLRDWGERYEDEMERARGEGRGQLTHPYFGKLDPVKAMRFMAVHIEHHTRQIA